MKYYNEDDRVFQETESVDMAPNPENRSKQNLELELLNMTDYLPSCNADDEYIKPGEPIYYDESISSQSAFS